MNWLLRLPWWAQLLLAWVAGPFWVASVAAAIAALALWDVQGVQLLGLVAIVPVQLISIALIVAGSVRVCRRCCAADWMRAVCAVAIILPQLVGFYYLCLLLYALVFFSYGPTI